MRQRLIPIVWRTSLLMPLVLVPWLARLDAVSRQLLFQWRGSIPVSDDVVLLGIDEASLDPQWTEFGPWPWPREKQAALARQVLRQGARRVVFNIVHAGPSGHGPEDDIAFQDVLKPWQDKVLLSSALVRQQLDDSEQIQLRRPWDINHQAGLSVFSMDDFGVVQSVPGLGRLQSMLEPFPRPHPLPLAHLAAEVTPSSGDDGIDFLGPSGSIPVIPAWAVGTLPEDTWRNKIVIIGSTAPSLGDQLETPFGQQSGSEVLLSAVSGLRSGRGFRSPEAIPLAALVVIWLLLCNWRIAGPSTALGTAIVSTALGALTIGLTVVSWCYGIWLPAAALTLMPFVAGGLRSGDLFQQESAQRRFLHSVLSRRVSPNLMRDMLRSGQESWMCLGGRRERCVVLFTDLVGFTARSNVMDAESLFGLLNRYFQAIAAPVLLEQGLLDKFIGDAVMAEFGVPVHRGDRVEALAAVRTALAMQANLEELNRELEKEGLEPLHQGIGIHCGEVIAGNLGSSDRLEYTVIGATVNLASRLESLTRQFPDYPILMSSDVRDQILDDVVVEDLGAHLVKGWPEPIKVFGLVSLRSSHDRVN
ncbi:adenylate/guanylate cyclase domain-containing protein [Synechococcus sp. GEYO]|uniref:adenylate/guanylate cyclase domain-containing protein n=1 Tax=Synechococcus sp. GEYO TaxID=2575511 RepID=UPI0010BCF7D1|nr:adenylate/guanylate cyclase domain-containing protein [Synechococcus sp. GEYO]